MTAAKDIFQKAFDFTRPDEFRQAGLYPFFPEFRGYDESDGAKIRHNDRQLLMFGSNNYLGLTRHPKVMEAAEAALRKYGTGCSGSRMLNGTLDLHVDLEGALAEWSGREKALLFGTGFQTNCGALSAIGERGDVICCDRNNHASILDGLLVSFANTERYRHNDMADLEAVLQSLKPGQGRLIVVDGVFSMEGDLADLQGVTRLGKQYGARVYVDEAHGVGVLGANGRGAAEHLGVEDDVDMTMATFSKSFASAGGFIAGPAAVIEYVKHIARAFVYSASMPPASVAAARAALEIIKDEPERREHLMRLAGMIRAGCRDMGYRIYDGHSAIIPVVIGDDPVAVCRFCQEVLAEGVYVNPVVPPATAEGLIRVTVMAIHAENHVHQLLEVLKRVGQKLGLI